MREQRDALSLGLPDLERILQWKLRSQYGRTARYRTLLTDSIVRQVTAVAFAVQHPDEEFETQLKVRLLCTLPGVGIGVASAILALTHPERYAVIDYRNWRKVFDEERTTFSLSQYNQYLSRIRDLAAQLGWRPQEVDLAIWEHDRRIGGSTESGRCVGQ
jgi:thermostable 8-oxoguanine DNA glycosylase